jgi:hypothetical protein
VGNEGRPSSESLAEGDQGLELDAAPAKTGQARSTAVEGQSSAAQASAPPHEVAGFLVQPAARRQGPRG